MSNSSASSSAAAESSSLRVVHSGRTPASPSARAAVPPGGVPIIVAPSGVYVPSGSPPARTPSVPATGRLSSSPEKKSPSPASDPQFNEIMVKLVGLFNALQKAALQKCYPLTTVENISSIIQQLYSASEYYNLNEAIEQIYTNGYNTYFPKLLGYFFPANHELKLTGNEVSHIGRPLIKYYLALIRYTPSSNHHITHIDFSQLFEVPGHVLANFITQSNITLTSLNLSGCCLKEADYDLIISRHQNLNTLDVSNPWDIAHSPNNFTKVSPAGIVRLIAANQSLKELHGRGLWHILVRSISHNTSVTCRTGFQYLEHSSTSRIASGSRTRIANTLEALTLTGLWPSHTFPSASTSSSSTSISLPSDFTKDDNNVHAAFHWINTLEQLKILKMDVRILTINPFYDAFTLYNYLPNNLHTLELCASPHANVSVFQDAVTARQFLKLLTNHPQLTQIIFSPGCYPTYHFVEELITIASSSEVETATSSSNSDAGMVNIRSDIKQACGTRPKTTLTIEIEYDAITSAPFTPEEMARKWMEALTKYNPIQNTLNIYLNFTLHADSGHNNLTITLNDRGLSCKNSNKSIQLSDLEKIAATANTKVPHSITVPDPTGPTAPSPNSPRRKSQDQSSHSKKDISSTSLFYPTGRTLTPEEQKQAIAAQRAGAALSLSTSMPSLITGSTTPPTSSLLLSTGSPPSKPPFSISITGAPSHAPLPPVDAPRRQSRDHGTTPPPPRP